MLWGKRNSDHYPFRNKIYDFVTSKKNKINVQILEHPGYDDTNKIHDIVGKKLHLLLSNFWFSLCTCENKNYNCSFIRR